MRLLALDAAVGWCSVALIEDGVLIGEQAAPRAHGQAEMLPLQVHELLANNRKLDAVAVTTGPGSFTGLRTALALAHGLAIGGGASLIGVTVGEAIREAIQSQSCWVALRAARDRIFLDRQGICELFDQDNMPPCDPGVSLAGDAAALVAQIYSAQGLHPIVSGDYQPLARAVARCAIKKLIQGDTLSAAIMPLYGDDPAVKQMFLRPAPVIAS